MSEETQGPEETQSPPLDDSRFEVKWRKKDSGTTPPPPLVEAESSETEDAASLRRQLDEAQDQIRNLQDRWQRSAADLANLRRRTEQEKGDVEKFASMMLVAELLPVLDNFERALATVPGNLAMLTWVQGVALIERHFQAILEHQGLATIDAQGQPFNPHYHEAISEQESAEVPAGSIVQVYQKGYSMHGRVIRPSLVEIAKAPAPKDQPPADEPAAGETTPDDAESIAETSETENVGP